MRRRLTVLITFLAGLYFFLEFMLPPVIPTGAAEGQGFRFGKFDEQITIGFTAVGAMAFALGAISILHAHGGNILRMRKRWVISAALIASVVVSAIISSAMWSARTWSSGMPKQLERLTAAQEIVITSAQTPPVPPHLRDRPKEELPPELQRTATTEERAATQGKLVARLEVLAAELGKQPRPPFEQQGKHPTDELLEALVEAQRAAGSGLERLKAGNDEGAEEDLKKSLAALRRASTSQRKTANLLLESSLSNKIYDLMFNGLYVALASAMFSLLAFYIATAAYRAFRIQSGESVLLMVAALLVMMGQIPLGVKIVDGVLGLFGVDSLSITQVRLWILRVVNTAAFRGIALGSAIAGLSMAWRVWWSMESGAFIDDPSSETAEAEAGESGGTT